MNEAVCAIMAKRPKVGGAKTRLSPPLTLQQAAALYEALLRDSIALVNSLPGIDLAVAVSPPDSQPFFKEITPPAATLLPVEGRDIGDCLSQVFPRLLDMGWQKVLAWNSDGPSLPPAYLQQAVQLLDENDIVLGPALDGGYYLVGMQHPHLGLFQDVTWSTAQVFAQTLEKAKVLGLQVGLVPEWYDVDTAGDLLRLQKDLLTLAPDCLVHTRRFLAGFDQALI